MVRLTERGDSVNWWKCGRERAFQTKEGRGLELGLASGGRQPPVVARLNWIWSINRGLTPPLAGITLPLVPVLSRPPAVEQLPASGLVSVVRAPNSAAEYTIHGSASKPLRPGFPARGFACRVP